MQIHTVKQGETPESIAALYGVDLYEFSALNGISAGFSLPEGMAVIILTPSLTHIVLPGETLQSVAAEYETTVNALLRNNPWLSLEEPLRAGQRINIFYENSERTPAVVNAYAYPFINRALFRSVLPFMSRMIPFTYGFTRSGALIVPDDSWMISTAYQYGVAPVMHISTLSESGGFDSSLAELALTDPALQSSLISSILRVLQEKGYTSVDIDFEYIPQEYATEYYRFIQTLTDTLNPFGYEVIIALAPKTSSNQRGLLYEAHDYALLGRAANAVLLMTYEWGYSAGPPMAVSPIEKVREVLNYAVTVIPRNKIYMGVSLYGYDWTLPYMQGNAPARSLSPEEAVALASANGETIQYSMFAQAPFFYYNSLGQTHEVWFEDARSMSARLRLISEYGIRGAGFWHAGRGAMQCWQTLNSLCDIVSL